MCTQVHTDLNPSKSLKDHWTIEGTNRTNTYILTRASNSGKFDLASPHHFITHIYTHIHIWQIYLSESFSLISQVFNKCMSNYVGRKYRLNTDMTSLLEMMLSRHRPQSCSVTQWVMGQLLWDSLAAATVILLGHQDIFRFTAYYIEVTLKKVHRFSVRAPGTSNDINSSGLAPIST